MLLTASMLTVPVIGTKHRLLVAPIMPAARLMSGSWWLDLLPATSWLMMIAMPGAITLMSCLGMLTFFYVSMLRLS